MTAIEVREYDLPEVSLSEVLRYSSCSDASSDVRRLAIECISETEGIFCGRVCFAQYPIACRDGLLDLGFAATVSRDLSKNLAGCEGVVVFAATVGIEIDRLIKKYSILSPSRAVMLQAVGSERIEALCDIFCLDLKARSEARGFYARARFSPGYGDLSLELQRDIFRALDCPRRIGATLNQSLLISPSKSVTAIAGLSRQR